MMLDCPVYYLKTLNMVINSRSPFVSLLAFGHHCAAFKHHNITTVSAASLCPQSSDYFIIYANNLITHYLCLCVIIVCCLSIWLCMIHS